MSGTLSLVAEWRRRGRCLDHDLRLLVKKQAIVSRLVAIEELAGVDVLCSGRTGTLTQNKLTIGDPFAAGQTTVAQVILSAALASRADDDDLAALAALDSDQARGYQVTHFQPFGPVGKRTEATVTGPDGTTFKVTKGAPQVIIELASNSAQVKEAVDRRSASSRPAGSGRWTRSGPTGSRRCFPSTSTTSSTCCRDAVASSA